MKLKLSLFAMLLITPFLARAETKTYVVTGMTCAGCVSMIEDKVCSLKTLAKCEVEVGKITLTSANTEKINDAEIAKLVAAAGSTYELVLPEASPSKTKKTKKKKN